MIRIQLSKRIRPHVACHVRVPAKACISSYFNVIHCIFVSIRTYTIPFLFEVIRGNPLPVERPPTLTQARYISPAEAGYPIVAIPVKDHT